MKKLLLALLLLFSSTGFSQHGRIEIGVIDSLQSQVLGEAREIWVHVPKQPEYYGDYFAHKRYPVLYLLDGDWHFQAVTGLMHFLSSENGAGMVPEMIVVAVVNTNRTRDFTPTNSTKNWDGTEARYLRQSGGGEKFTAFLEKELIPYIDAKYPTEQYRMLVGHSFGGLLVTNTLVDKPELFNSYVAIDPSLWWDDKLVLKKAINDFKKGDLKGKKLYLALADSALTVKQDPTSTTHVRANMEFARLLDRQSSRSLRWKYYADENHFSLFLYAVNDAMRAFLAHEPLPIPEAGVQAATFNAQFVEEHYNSITTNFGYKVLPPESLVYSFALACLNRDLPDKALGFLQLNKTNYPQSFGVYDALGDYYSKKGDRKKAIEHFTKALSIRENPETLTKLNGLRKNK
ncbi:hypothetical protein C8N40_11438 [Pontibacter mucosus]|uniref:Uncharacterized protein n=1 Tax=Pontibacter mucosus TaxID=1649266 RepID=A0A2T5Y7G8_9BACT|nr:alpha/beta hydrolase-fold protein [Pontibacter mucosus]PTX12240.1 hypothetical protein C8N40_11438 [Pontibacter mucosus]